MKAREILEELTQNTMGNPPYRIDQALTQLREGVRWPEKLDKVFGCTGIKRDRDFYREGANFMLQACKSAYEEFIGEEVKG